MDEKVVVTKTLPGLSGIGTHPMSRSLRLVQATNREKVLNLPSVDGIQEINFDREYPKDTTDPEVFDRLRSVLLPEWLLEKFPTVVGFPSLMHFRKVEKHRDQESILQGGRRIRVARVIQVLHGGCTLSYRRNIVNLNYGEVAIINPSCIHSVESSTKCWAFVWEVREKEAIEVLHAQNVKEPIYNLENAWFNTDVQAMRDKVQESVTPRSCNDPDEDEEEEMEDTLTEEN